MRTRKLAGRDAAVLVVGSSYFGGDCPEEKAWDILDKYVSEGGNHIDTARVYGRMSEDVPGDAEKVIGRWLARRHDAENFVIGTKGGHPSLRHMDVSRLDRESLSGDAHASVDALGRACDVYWLHRDDRAHPVEDIIDTLNLLKEEGNFTLFGASNWDMDRIGAADRYAARQGLMGFSGTQVQFSLAHALALPDPTCRMMTGDSYARALEEGLFAFAFSSQAKGLFTVLAEKGEAGLSAKSRARYLSEDNLAIFEKLKLLSARKGVPVSALALAWLTSQPLPTWAIVGASRPEQLDGLRSAGDVVLTEEEIKYLRNIQAEA